MNSASSDHCVGWGIGGEEAEISARIFGSKGFRATEGYESKPVMKVAAYF